MFRFENIIPLSASQVHPQRRGAGCRLQRRERRRCLSLRLALPFSASHRPRTAVSCTSAASHCTAHPCASHCRSVPLIALAVPFLALPLHRIALPILALPMPFSAFHCPRTAFPCTSAAFLPKTAAFTPWFGGRQVIGDVKVQHSGPPTPPNHYTLHVTSQPW